MHRPASIPSPSCSPERGRSLHDAGSLRAAVGQYEFLRTQYPGSSLRVSALLAEGQIEQNDLSDPRAARDRYQTLLKEYPRSSAAEEARAALDKLGKPTRSQSVASVPAPAVDAQPGREAAVAPAETAAHELPVPAASPNVDATPQRVGGLAQVTGIRHWSTPSYTRVVIDLGDNVTYEAARVPNPDRIYFDLHGTHLVPELVNKTFSVTDDGFLRRIRAAQFRDHMTRVVLDVNDVTEYSAFLLPNPYRLIIDVHGRIPANGTRPSLASLPPEATVMKPSGELKTAAPVAPTPVPDTKAARSKKRAGCRLAQRAARPRRGDEQAYIPADLGGGIGRPGGHRAASRVHQRQAHGIARARRFLFGQQQGR